MTHCLLDETEFDVIIYGTGITETYLSGALAVAGKRVLHLEENEYYGGAVATLPFNQFNQFLHKQLISKSPREPAPELPEHTRTISLVSIPNITANELAKFNEKNEEKNEEKKEEIELENQEKTEENPQKIETVQEQIVKEDRRYNIDVTSNMLRAKGTDVDNLVKSGTHRYVEFHCISHTYLQTQETIEQVPCSKKDIFRSKYISLKEKRSLMKFVSLAIGEKPEGEETSTNSVDMSQSFTDFVNSQQLSEKLKEILYYVIALLPAASNSLNTEQGLALVKQYMQSQGQYGDTPFLYPLYGLSEICQAYSRLAAVNSGIFILQRCVQSLVVSSDTSGEQNRFLGVVCGAGQYLTAPLFISTAKFFPSSTSTSKLSRGVFIIDKSIVEGESLINLVIPPSSTFSNTLFVNQLDHTVHCVPREKFLLQFVCNYQENAHEHIHAALHRLVELSSTKPNVLYEAYFDILDHTVPEEAIPKGVYLCNEAPSTSVGFDHHLVEARRIFAQICGEETEFFPQYDYKEHTFGDSD